MCNKCVNSTPMISMHVGVDAQWLNMFMNNDLPHLVVKISHFLTPLYAMYWGRTRARSSQNPGPLYFHNSRTQAHKKIYTPQFIQVNM